MQSLFSCYGWRVTKHGNFRETTGDVSPVFFSYVILFFFLTKYVIIEKKVQISHSLFTNKRLEGDRSDAFNVGSIDGTVSADSRERPRPYLTFTGTVSLQRLLAATTSSKVSHWTGFLCAIWRAPINIDRDARRQ